ncbi:MAG: hypothetical protein JWL86_2401 [Rhizobium sp.]|nr:hypothetical protein [Rhizobium sp.]
MSKSPTMKELVAAEVARMKATPEHVRLMRAIEMACTKIDGKLLVKCINSEIDAADAHTILEANRDTFNAPVPEPEHA